MTETPASGDYRSDLTFNDSGFAPNQAVQVYAAGVGSPVLAGGTADAFGSFAATGRAPQSYYGPRIFLGTSQASGLLGAATFSTNPRLAVAPDAGPPGTDVIVEAVGFGSLETIEFVWNATGASLARRRRM